jgi:thiamine pyrophosphate-dependent acetolactate synthase large subunit-like protein
VMVLCLVVHNYRRESSSTADQNVEEDILPLLKQAYAICAEKSSASRDSRYVSRAIAALLDGPVTRVTVPNIPVDHQAYSAADGVSLGWLDPFYIEDSVGLDWGLLDSLLLYQPGEETGKD